MALSAKIRYEEQPAFSGWIYGQRGEAKREFNKEFPYESELKQKLIRQQEINNELEIKDEGEELVVTEELPEPAMSR